MSAPAEQDAEQPEPRYYDGVSLDTLEAAARICDRHIKGGPSVVAHDLRRLDRSLRRSAPAPSTAGKTNAAPEGAAPSGESTEASPEHAGPLGQQDGASEGTTGFTPLSAPSRNRAAPTLARKEGDRNVIATTDPGECSRCGNHICRGVKVFPICEYCAPAPSTAATEALERLIQEHERAARYQEWLEYNPLRTDIPEWQEKRAEAAMETAIARNEIRAALSAGSASPAPDLETRAEPDEPFAAELAYLINRRSLENESNTPDFILAEYMAAALQAFVDATNRREVWYGRRESPEAFVDVGPAAPVAAAQERETK